MKNFKIITSIVAAITITNIGTATAGDPVSRNHTMDFEKAPALEDWMTDISWTRNAREEALVLEDWMLDFSGRNQHAVEPLQLEAWMTDDTWTVTNETELVLEAWMLENEWATHENLGEKPIELENWMLDADWSPEEFIGASPEKLDNWIQNIFHTLQVVS